MTEKAKELVDNFYYAGIDKGKCHNPIFVMTYSKAKQCALICVVEMIDFIELCGDNFNWCYTSGKIKTPLEYWEKVKKEIEKL